MSFESSIVRSAKERLDNRKFEHQQAFYARQERIYSKIPSAKSMEKQLQQTVTLAAVTALRSGEDVSEAIDTIKNRNLSLQNELQQLLVSNGYPIDALDYKPLCPFCNDTGYTKYGMCSCLKQLCIEEQNKRLSTLLDFADADFNQFNLNYYRTPEAQNIMKAVLRFCQRYATSIQSFPKRNIIIAGNTGIGKTFLSTCIAKEFSKQGYSVVYETAIQFFENYENYKFNRSDEAKSYVQRYLNCDLLIIDDLGSEFHSPVNETNLYNIVNTRLVNKSYTVITTNLNSEDLSKRYSRQTISRFDGEYQKLNCFNVYDDVRKNKI